MNSSPSGCALDEGMELLPNLGVANLAMGAAGLGVSMVGFGVMRSSSIGSRHLSMRIPYDMEVGKTARILAGQPAGDLSQRWRASRKDEIALRFAQVPR